MTSYAQEIARLWRVIEDMRQVPALYTAWDDQQVNISGVRIPTSGAPTWTAYKGSYVLSFSASSTNTIYFVAQLTHRYRVETDIEFHLHLAYPDANAGNTYWEFTHSWASIGDTFPAASTVNATIASSGVADEHQLADIASTISGTGQGISSVLLCSLARLGGNAADTYASAVYLTALDFHIECDSLGSRQEATK